MFQGVLDGSWLGVLDLGLGFWVVQVHVGAVKQPMGWGLIGKGVRVVM